MFVYKLSSCGFESRWCHLAKLSLQIRTRINPIMKTKLPYCNIQFIIQTKCKITFLYLKTKFHRSYVLTLFTTFSVVASMLPIIEKLIVILTSEYVTTWEFLHSLGKELKVMTILPLKNIFYSVIIHLILKIFQFLLPTTTTLKLR